MTMKGVRRGLLFTLLILLVLAGVVLVAGRSYLRSSHAAAQVASRLEAAAGAPVEVADVQIGLTGDSELRGLRFYEPGKATEEPWAVIDTVKADVSAWDVLRGEAMPQQLVLSGASMILRFDRQGKLLTQLPRSGEGGAVPTIRIERGKVTLRQEGRRDMVVGGVNAQLVPEGDRLVLTGALADPLWGNWDLQATVQRGNGATAATLHTERAHVTQALLESIALIDPDVWKHVQAVDGVTPVTFTLNVEPGSEPAHYRVTLAPQALAIFIPDVDLKLEQARGKIDIADGTIRLRDVWARTAGGELEGNAELELHDTPERFHFAVKVRGLDLARLPANWDLPKQITGNLSGHADLRLVNEKAGLRTSGQGEGTIANARVANQPAAPIVLKLHGDGKRFRFTPQASARGPATAALAALTLLAGQAAPAPEEDPFLPAQVVRWLAQGTDQAQRGARTAARWLVSAVQPKPARPRKLPNYLEVNLSLRDADLLQLLKGLGVAVPFSITGTNMASPVFAASMVGMTGGPLEQWPFLAAAALPTGGPRITVQVQAAIPIDAPRDLKAYRLKGTARLPSVVLEGVPLDQVQASVVYDQGILRLEDLRGQVPVVGQASGKFHGSARLEVVPQGNLTAQLGLEQLPLQQVLSVVPGATGRAQGRFYGTFLGTAPANRLQDSAAWNVTGRLRSEQLQAYGLTLQGTEASIRVRNGVLTLAGVKANLEGSPITGQGRLTLSGAYPFEGRLELPKVDLAALQRLSPDLRPPVPVAGRFSAAGDLRGTLNPLTLTTTGDGSAQGVKLQDFQLGSLSFHWDSNADRLRLNKINAGLYRGEIVGSVVLPLRPTESGSIDLRLQKLDLGGIVKGVPGVPFSLEGKADGTVKGNFAPAKPGQERTFKADIDVRADDLRVQGIPAERARGAVHYDPEGLRYNLDAETLGGTMHLDGKFPRRRPAAPEADPQSKRLLPGVDLDNGSGQLRIQGAQLGELWRALGIQDTLGPLQGRVDVQIELHPARPDHVVDDYRNACRDRTPLLSPGQHSACESDRAESLPVQHGTGLIVINELRWSTADANPSRLQAEIQLGLDELRIVHITSGFPGGTVGGRVTWNFRDPDRRQFELLIRDMPAERLSIFWPALDNQVTGNLTASIRGRFGPTWTGGADILLARGHVLGVAVTDWHLPVAFEFAPAQRDLRLRVAEATAQLGLGRATGRATWDLGEESRLEGQIRFFNVDLRTLLSQSQSQTVAGRASGTIDFGGSPVRSLNDVTANVQASFQDTQAMQLPVLQQLAPFLRLGMGSSATFQSGDLRGRLAGGVFRIQRLTLVGNTVQLLIAGAVTLDGRLNLDATANIGSGGLGLGAALLGLRLPVTGAIPLGLLSRVSAYLTNHVIHLRVTGTVRNPVIHFEPLTLVSEEVARFFLLSAAGLPLP